MTICLCGETLIFLMNNKSRIIWECPSCGRLLLRPGDDDDWQRWYYPEGGILVEGWNKPKK